MTAEPRETSKNVPKLPQDPPGTPRMYQGPTKYPPKLSRPLAKALQQQKNDLKKTRYVVVLPPEAQQPHTSSYAIVLVGSKSMWLCCTLLDKRTADDTTPNGCSSCLFVPVPACSLLSPYSSNTVVLFDTAVTRSVLNRPYPMDTWRQGSL